MTTPQSLGPARLLEKVWTDVHARETPDRLLLVVDWLVRAPGEPRLKRELCPRAAEVATKCISLLDVPHSRGGCAAILLLATVAWHLESQQAYRSVSLITETLMEKTQTQDSHRLERIPLSSAHILLLATQKLVAVCLHGLCTCDYHDSDFPESTEKWQSLLCWMLSSVFLALERCETTFLVDRLAKFCKALGRLPLGTSTRLQERMYASSLQLLLEPLYEAMVGLNSVGDTKVLINLLTRVFQGCIHPWLAVEINDTHAVPDSFSEAMALVAACGMRSAILMVPEKKDDKKAITSLLHTIESLIVSQIHFDTGKGLVFQTICGVLCCRLPFQANFHEEFSAKISYCACKALTTLGLAFAMQGLPEMGIAYDFDFSKDKAVDSKWQSQSESQMEAMLGALTTVCASCPSGFLRNPLVTHDFVISASDANWLYREIVRIQISQRSLSVVHGRLQLLFNLVFKVLDGMVEAGNGEEMVNPLPGQVLDIAARLQFCRPTNPPSPSYSRVLKVMLMGLARDAGSTLFLIESSFPANDFYDELLTEYTESGQPVWYSDTVVASQVQFLMMALEPCIGNSTACKESKAAFMDSVLPVALLYTQHFHPPTSQSAHRLIWALLQNFESHFESTVEVGNLSEFYIHRCLEACWLSWNAHSASMLAQGLSTLVRSIGRVVGPSKGTVPIAIRCIDQVIAASREPRVPPGNREQLFSIAVAQLAWVHYGLMDLLCRRFEKYNTANDPSLWQLIGQVVVGMDNCVRKPRLIAWYRSVGSVSATSAFV